MNKNSKLSGQPVICQLLSLIPKNIVSECAEMHGSDRYYKTMTTYKHLVFMLYGVISKCNSLNSLCKNMLFLENRLSYLGINKLPAVSTLSDANINRDSKVFESIYLKLYDHYKAELTPRDCALALESFGKGNVSIFDSSTISLFVDVFKGAGRNKLNGKKKGGLKVHARLPLRGNVPDVIHLTEAKENDKCFLGQQNPNPGDVLVFDKGYANYLKWYEWNKKGVHFVTRINENADYEVCSEVVNDISEYADGGVITDQVILLNPKREGIRLRLITYMDPENRKVLRFVTNLFGYRASTAVMLYKYRWNIELLFKRLKQNFELGCFFSDSPEGIKTQVWMALIANLIFSVIHRRVKEAEAFVTLVSLASNNMGSYISLIKLVCARKLTSEERNIGMVQLELFNMNRRGCFQQSKKHPLRDTS